MLLSERRDINYYHQRLAWRSNVFESLMRFVIPSSDFVQDILRDVRPLRKILVMEHLRGDKQGNGLTPIPGNRNDNPAWTRVDEIAKTIL